MWLEMRRYDKKEREKCEVRDGKGEQRKHVVPLFLLCSRSLSHAHTYSTRKKFFHSTSLSHKQTNKHTPSSSTHTLTLIHTHSHTPTLPLHTHTYTRIHTHTHPPPHTHSLTLSLTRPSLSLTRGVHPPHTLLSHTASNSVQPFINFCNKNQKNH
jgi:hypothetical protein